MAVKPEIPECLKKHGITRVEDNLDGRRVKLDGTFIGMLFEDELKQFHKELMEKRIKENEQGK